MSNWRDEYFAALGVRDEREKANISIYDAYTRLADRTSRLESHPTTHKQHHHHHHHSSSSTPLSGSHSHPQSYSPSQSQPQQTGSPVPASGKKPTSSASKREGSSARSQNLPDLLASARQDLVEAQKSRTELLERLNKIVEEHERLKKKSSLDGQKMADLAVERTQLQVRMKDRDEELRGKAKLLDDLQDEVVSLNLQFNMAEERSDKLRKENQELIDRWMARMGQEAEAMNKASKFA